MRHSIVKKLLKDCEYCAKEIGKDNITPNIILHVLSLDPSVSSEIILGGGDPKILAYLLNPYHLRVGKIKKTIITHESKQLFDEIGPRDTYLDIFKKLLNHRFIKEILIKSGYMRTEHGDDLLLKYTKKIEDGTVRKMDVDKYKKINQLLGSKNVMVMGAIGSGRYQFIKDYAKYNSERFTIYYFDLFKYLKLDEGRLFGIVNGIFEELGDNYIYIPNFLQTLIWVKSLKQNELHTLLEELAYKGRIITKVNKNNFDAKQFHLSKLFNFFSVNCPNVTLNDLYEILNTNALIFEKFYGIEVTKEEIKAIIKESNFKDNVLAQPGKSLKRLMHLCLVKYGKDETIQEKPKERKSFLDDISLESLLNAKIIGQVHPIEELSYEISKVNFLEGGIVRAFFFQGEIGCGKLKTARELSRLLFGEDSLRYLDLMHYKEFPFKLKIYEEIDKVISSMYGGVIFLDNIEYLDTEEIDIFSYMKMKVKETNFDDIMAPIIVIASSRLPVTQINNYKYIIENFDKIIYFNKLTIRDLEKVAELEIDKIKDFIKNKEDLNTFLISANSNPMLNALGVKKLITSMSL